MTELTRRTAAETLRATAALLRERAAQATPGPWDYDLFSEDGPWEVVRDDPFTEIAVCNDENDRSKVNANWIRAMHPGLAEPLAALLEHQAETEETLQGPLSLNRRDALAVARVILGETPADDHRTRR